MAVALCAAPVAAADGKHGHDGHAAVVPVHKIAGAPAGEILGQDWVEVYGSHPGDTEDRCEIVGGRRTALLIGPAPEPHTCSVDRHTQLVVYGPSVACSDVEPEPYFGADEAAQRRCAAEGDYKFVHSIQVTVDDLTVQIRRPRFEIFTPQMTAQVPEDNILGVPAGTAHLVGHQWVAQVRKLRPGQHTIRFDLVTSDFAGTRTYIISIGRGH